MEQFPTEQNDNKSGILTNNISPQTPSLTVEQLDIEILPVIYDIIRCVEKNPVDNAAKQRESQECSQKILELQKRFDSARNQIKQLPGIDYNKEEQLQKLEQLKNQLMLKQKLIKKYKNKQYLANNEHLVQRLSESYIVRRAAQLVVSAMYRTKSLAQEHNLQQMTPERFKAFVRTFRQNIKQEIEDAKVKLKEKKS